jgi:hypothetical protein
MKSVIVASLLALAATHADAGSWLKQDRPCGAKCPAPKTVPVVRSPLVHQNLDNQYATPGDGNTVYQSQTHIRTVTTTLSY